MIAIPTPKNNLQTGSVGGGKSMRSPETLDYLLDRIAVGYRMGAKAKPFLAQKWEDNWEQPLTAWRDRLGVEIAAAYIA